MRPALWFLPLLFLGSVPASAVDLDAVFVPAGALEEAISTVSGTHLPDGRVLFSGGWQAQAYDPQANVWQPSIHFQGDHFMAATALLADGRVLVAGTPSPAAGPAAELLDPATSQVDPVVPGPSRRYGAVLMARSDGRVVMWAGMRAGTSWPPVAASELFDPATNAFSALDVAVPPRWNAAVVELARGAYLIAGGSIADGVVQAQAVVYDADANTASPAGSQTGFFSAQSGIRLQDGRVLLCGGYLSAGGATRSTNRAEMYDPRTGQFTSLPSMHDERAGAALALLPDGNVLVVGGQDSWDHYLGTAEVFDVAAGAFSRVSASLINARAGAMALPMGQGRFILAGGQGAVGAIGEAEAFIPDAIMAASFD